MRENSIEYDISVVVISYNQSNYISDCLSGLFSQKTDLRIEYIICDDHSVDDTWDKITSAVEKNQDKDIKIFRHNKNIGAIPNIIYAFSKAKGKYLASCEGDDVWLEPEKLNKQYQSMMRHPDINISFHPVLKGTLEQNSVYRYLGSEIKMIDPEVIARGGGSFMPSASLMFRNSSIQSLLPYLNGAITTDVLFQIWCSKEQGALYLPWPMAVYRTGVVGSWSSQQGGFKSRLIHLKTQASFLKSFVKRLSDADRKWIKPLLSEWIAEKYKRLFKQSANQFELLTSVIALINFLWYRLNILLIKHEK